MPLASARYGVLLGLGFTTFVLSLGVWALAGIASRSAIRRPASVGIAFGVGRALPSWRSRRSPTAARGRAHRGDGGAPADPARLPRRRRAGAAGVGRALVGGVLAGAARTDATPAADPGAGGEAVVFSRPNGSGILRDGGHNVDLPGTDPAIGGGRIAVIAEEARSGSSRPAT